MPRLFYLVIINILLVVVLLTLAPHQLPVTLYKLSLVTAAGLVGYWLDRALFPYARPDEFTDRIEIHTPNKKEVDFKTYVIKGSELVFASCLIRRAIIVGCAMLAMGLGA